MSGDRGHVRRKKSDDRTKLIASVCIAAGCVALTSAYLLTRPTLGWFVLNLLLWSLPSLAIWVFARELLRALIAVVLGFRIFEIQWGAGPERLSFRVRDCVLRIASIPVLGHVEAASPSPHHYRLKRWLLATGPLLAQLAWALFGQPLVAEGRPTATQGLAPLAIFHLANLGLIGLHALLPIETRSGLRSDIRRIFDLLAASPGRNRAERAIFYVQAGRRRIEGGDLAAAREILDQGRVALGPEPVLVALGDRLEEVAHAPASPPTDLDFDDPRATTRVAFVGERASLSFLHRLQHAVASCIPILLVFVFAGVAQRQSLSEILQTRWARSTGSVASSGEAPACRRALADWSRWVPRLDLLSSPSPTLRVARHDALARLHGCLGDPGTAELHQAEALAAAQETPAPERSNARADSPAPTRHEIGVARQLRRIAHWQVTRGTFRDSLSSLVRADHYLERARRQLESVADLTAKESLQGEIEREADETELARAHALNRMGARERSRAAYDALLARRADAADASPEFLERLSLEYTQARREWNETPRLVRTGP